MRIVVAPWSNRLRNGRENPKNYPYWQELIKRLREEGHYIIQIGRGDEQKLDADLFLFDKSLKEISKIIESNDIWITVDSFLPHMANFIGKRGIVLWGYSDPEIFGYKQNINLLKDRKYLRENQFEIWDSVPHNNEVFVEVETVMNTIKEVM